MTKSIYSPAYLKMREMLKAEREKAKLSPALVADKLGVNQTYVSKYEKGERRLDLIEFLEIAEAVGFDPLDFIKRLQDSK